MIPHPTGGRRFMVGVELLLGLALGAAALAALVSFLVVMLQGKRLEDERRGRGFLVAEALASGLADSPSPETLAGLFRRYEIAGIAEEAVLLGPGEAPPGGDDWFSSVASGGAAVAVRMPPAEGGAWDGLGPLLGAIAAVLVLLALLSPSYVSRNLTGPLRGLLADAGRSGAGDSTSAVSAGASFSRLVDMLAQRDSELEALRTRAEVRADIAEAGVSAMTSAVGSPVCAIDPRGGLMAFNTAAEELFGIVQEDRGKPFPPDRTALGAVVSEMLAAGDGDQDHSERTVEEEGGEKVYSVSVSRSPGGMTAVLATDLSGVRALERRLAEEAAMAGLGTASAGIAHEMGNTLCALSGFMDLLARGRDDPRTAELIGEARAEVHSALKMIESFKMMSSAGFRSPVAVDASDLVRAARSWASQISGRVDVRAAGIQGSVAADPDLLEKAVVNLLRNARDADPSGIIELSLETADGRLSITVSDRGHGLPPDPSVVLTPFFSTRGDQGHMGMGLTLARRIAMSFGGDLRACSREGGGATFVVMLPLREA